jgi:hypothetical protein
MLQKAVVYYRPRHLSLVPKQQTQTRSAAENDRISASNCRAGLNFSKIFQTRCIADNGVSNSDSGK